VVSYVLALLLLRVNVGHEMRIQDIHYTILRTYTKLSKLGVCVPGYIGHYCIRRVQLESALHTIPPLYTIVYKQPLRSYPKPPSNRVYMLLLSYTSLLLLYCADIRTAFVNIVLFQWRNTLQHAAAANHVLMAEHAARLIITTRAELWRRLNPMTRKRWMYLRTLT